MTAEQKEMRLDERGMATSIRRWNTMAAKTRQAHDEERRLSVFYPQSSWRTILEYWKYAPYWGVTRCR
jgi:hypothetical protein